MKSIFDIENRLNITKEYEKLIEAFFNDHEAILYRTNQYGNKVHGTIIDAINNEFFLDWKYRDTFLNAEEYLEHLGINIEEAVDFDNYYIEEEEFLYFLEFLVNMVSLIGKSRKVQPTNKSIAYVQNISRILEKMNYKSQEQGDRIIIVKRDSDVDSVIELVPETIAISLLEYNDFKIRNDIESKKKILKTIDLYIEKNVKIKEFDTQLDAAIGMIVNKMGVNHPINEEPYKSFTDEELLEWYDKCFLMMLHAIRTVEVNKIKSERKEFLNKV